MTFRSLSGYRIMWVMALFDLPVLTPEERKRATKFREGLLDQGFCMMQFSCYLKFTAGKEQPRPWRLKSVRPFLLEARSMCCSSRIANMRRLDRSAARANAAARRNPISYSSFEAIRTIKIGPARDSCKPSQRVSPTQNMKKDPWNQWVTRGPF